MVLLFPLIKLAKKLKDGKLVGTGSTGISRFPLIKLAKKLKDNDREWLCSQVQFPLIKLAKKLKEAGQSPFKAGHSGFPLIKLAKKLKDLG